jgi:hypothetical protein
MLQTKPEQSEPISYEDFRLVFTEHSSQTKVEWNDKKK